MGVNDTSRIIIDTSRVMLQIVASLPDDSRGINYDCNMFVEQTTDLLNLKHRNLNIRSLKQSNCGAT